MCQIWRILKIILRVILKEETKQEDFLGIGCENCHSKTKGFFCGVAPAAIQDLNANKEARTVKRGQILYVEGKPVDGLYCIQSGKVKVIKNIDGKDAIVRISSSGDLLGHYGLFSTNKHFSTATALEDIQLCFLDKKLIFQLMEKHQDISSLFIKKLCYEMSSTKAKLSSIMNKNIRERLAELLLTLSESYGEANEDRIKLEIRLTREEMASMIGTVNETVTRFITEFKSDGIIEEEDKVIYITNQEKLMKVARVTHA